MSASQDPIEAAILSGVDSHPTSSYREDRRAAVTDSAPNTDDELGSDLPDDDDDDLYQNDDDPTHKRYGSSATTATAGGSRRSHGLSSSRTATRGEEGATNTGPKGVLRDRQLRAQQESDARTAAVHATNRKMESLALSSETYSEQVAREKRDLAAQLQRETRESDEEEDAVSRTAIADLQAKEKRREARIAELKTARTTAPTPPTSERYFGHLREVDERGYVAAIDNEDPRIPVVIHIYSKAVAQCNSLTASLASLARLYPRTKFLQVQASAIGFGHEEEEEEYDELDAKTLEVLPTLLVYRAGRLVANLVRVDLDPMWGHGREQDVRDLLDSHGALVGDGDQVASGGQTVAADDDDD